MQYEIVLPEREGYAAMVDGQRYELLPGDALIIPAGVVHELFAPEKGQRYIIMVDQDVIYATDGMVGIQHIYYPCVHLRRDRIPEGGMDLLWQAIRESERQEMLTDAAVVAWVRLFLIRVGRALLAAGPGSSGEHRHQMNENFLDIYAYITQHSNEKLTLEEIAAHSGYSKYHFSRIFREYTGMSFYEFYLRQRMLLCRQLLGEMRLPMTEIASRAGFGSLATFNRVFKQYEGITPTQFRRLRQKLPMRGAEENEARREAAFLVPPAAEKKSAPR